LSRPDAILRPYATKFTIFSSGGVAVLADWGHIGFLVLVGVALPAVALIVSVVFTLFKIRPRNPNKIKSETYECGVPTEGTAWVQFHAGYYLFALIFVVFDVETIFLYPWAVAFRQFAVYGFVEAMLFIAILLFGLAYAWRKRALEWA
jgi:NADH:ubiquinone oxidoreductase subunit 3 (subunit A)